MDAVIQMIVKVDYYTPNQADGTPGFKKHTLTSWVLMINQK